ERALNGGGEFKFMSCQAGTEGLLAVLMSQQLLGEELGEGMDQIHLAGIEGIRRSAAGQGEAAHRLIVMKKRMDQAGPDSREVERGGGTFTPDIAVVGHGIQLGRGGAAVLRAMAGE